jgi:hypothetical protein
MNEAKSLLKKLGVVGVAIGAPASAFAADYSTVITAAQTDATANQSLVMGAVIAVAVISFGAAAFLMWLRK